MKYLPFADLLDAEPANIAILSTYQLDPDFFERQLLRCATLAKARRILLFLDASRPLKRSQIGVNQHITVRA